MAEREKVHFLGSLPIDTQLVELLDSAPPQPATTTEEQPTESSGAQQEQVLNTDVTPVTQLNTLSGTGPETNGHTTVPALTGAFQVLERYQQTPTWTAFKPMAEYITEKLG